MNLQEVRSIAKTQRIDSAGMPKIEIIRTLQRKEGNFDCYGTAYDGVCDQVTCKWREDCLDASRG